MKDSSVRRGAHSMILSLLLAAGSCGGDSGTNGGDGDDGGGGTTPVVTTSVNVVDFAFEPPDIQVAAGATVTWTWTGGEGHNVTFANATITDSATQITGTHQAVMPTASGTYTYQCTIHPAQMQGSVLVP